MPKSDIIRGSILFGFGTLVSRIFGMIRDIVVAIGYGAGNASDAFFVAFRFVNLFRAFFAEGAISQAFIPNLAKVLQKQPKSANLFIGNILATISLLLLFLVVLLELSIEKYIDFYALGYKNNPAQRNLVGDILAIILPYILCICLGALACAVLQTHKRFIISGFSPVILNICMIIAACLALYQTNIGEKPVITTLAWAVCIAGFLQLALPFIQLFIIGIRPIWTITHFHPAFYQTLKMFFPILIAASVTQIGMFVDTLLATFLETGSVTWLYIANRLLAFPMGIFGISIAVAILPMLAKAQAKKDIQKKQAIFQWASQVVFFIALPAACGLIFAAKPIITLLFQYGQFNIIDVHNTANALCLYALGLPAMMYSKILLNVFFASGNAKTPLAIAGASTCINIIGSIILMQFFGFLGLALSTGLATLAHTMLLYFFGVKNNLFYVNSLLLHTLRFLCSCTIMVGAIFGILILLPDISNASFIIRLGSVVCIVIAASIVYIMSMILCGWRLRNLKYMA